MATGLTLTLFAAWNYDRPTIKLIGYYAYINDRIVTYVELRCQVDYDGGVPVTYIRGQRREVGAGLWIDNGKQTNARYEPNKYGFYNLIYGKKLEFRVFSANSFGESDPAMLNQVINT